MFEERLEEMRTFLDTNGKLPAAGTELRNWWMNNYNTKERYRRLRKDQQRVLDELAATLPQSNAFNERVDELKAFVDANGKLPAPGTVLRNWWKHNYNTDERYRKLTKDQQHVLNELAALLAQRKAFLECIEDLPLQYREIALSANECKR